jgi:hypothetical protein
MAEHEEQVALFDWAEGYAYKDRRIQLMHSIPNAGKRSYGAARYMKDEGLKSGVPDIFLPVPKLVDSKWVAFGLYIEMKYKKNKLLVNQKKWLKDLEDQGYQCNVCYSCEEAIEVIEEYLS